jgi:tetratricopeptide (TPR) repeat protein
MRALLVVAALFAAPALADDKADAVALFDEGIREMKAGNFAQACIAFEKSDRLQGDSGTRGSLARCYEKRGRIASAWKLWTELSTTAPKNLRADAAANAAKLEPKLPKYVLRMAQQAQVTIDGIAIDSAPDIEVPIDPGKHVVEANAAGFNAWKYEYTAVEGKLEELAIALVKQPSAEPEHPVKIPEGPSPRSSRRTIGIAVVAVGGAILAGGAVFGVIAKSRNDDAKDICGGDIDACDPARLADAQDKVDAARKAGNLSTVGFIVGGAAVVTGIVLFVTAPKSTKRHVSIVPAVHPDGAGVVIRGGF